MSKRDDGESGDGLITNALEASNDTGEREDYKALVAGALERYTDYLASGSQQHTTECSSNDSLDDENVEMSARQPETPVQRPCRPEVINIFEDYDVLFGRGKESNHYGNRYLRSICREKLSLYELSDRDEKTEISRKIVKEIQALGGRFLKQDKVRDGWLVVSDKAALRKVSHFMRDARQLGGVSK